MKALIEAKEIEDILIKAMASTILAAHLKHEEAEHFGLNTCVGLAAALGLTTDELDAYKEKAEKHLEKAMDLLKEHMQAVKH
jgi:3-methyladenine DNA glycosylase Tag